MTFNQWRQSVNKTFASGKNYQEIFDSSLNFVDTEFYYIFHFLLIFFLIFCRFKNFGQDFPRDIFLSYVSGKLFRMFYYIVYI